MSSTSELVFFVILDRTGLGESVDKSSVSVIKATEQYF